ncbi:MAG: tetratricopeptide repeat protein [Pirellulales bacterium]
MGNSHHMVKLGAIYERQGRMAKAEDLFRQALGIDPSLTEARFQLGLCLYERHDYAAAAQCMEAVCAEKTDYGYGSPNCAWRSRSTIWVNLALRTFTPRFFGFITHIPRDRCATPNC